MNYKILSEEHRIVAAPVKSNGGLHIIYSHSIDTILINADCQNLEKTAKIMTIYLTIEGHDRLDAANCTNNESIKGVLHVLDQVARIRRRLNRSRRA